MPITHQLDHAEQAVERLLGIYQGKPRIQALLLSYVNRCQKLEDAVYGVITKRLIDDAADAQLDAIGRIVGEHREGKDDATFRIYVLARIRINWSHGHPRDIIEVLQIVESAVFQYREGYPASVEIEYQAEPATDPNVLLDLARQAKPAGVRLGLIAPAVDGALTFAFSHEGAANDPERAFGHEGSTLYGGVFSSEYV